jgi:predicted AlkP superfamily pyrophosphatase or phosphodiesterase
MISNGLYHERLRKILFWEQAASLVEGPRIWETFRANGGTVGLMFWQQSLGEAVDLIVSPRPIHKHGGGLIQDVYTQPRGLYDRLKKAVGRPFNLMHYWGPLASAKSSQWIAEAVGAVMGMPDVAPDLLLAYLPLLDYDLQRYGPDHPRADAALRELETQLELLCTQARAHDYEILIFGDYAIAPASHGAVFPNRALREAGLFDMYNIKGMLYPDFWSSRAFAMVDHEVAHVYVPDTSALTAAREVLTGLEGVEQVLDRDAQNDWGIDHPHSGDFVLVAKEGYWFAYPWWTDRKEAPDFASHVDIHNKPGFDPCELFFGWPPGSVSANTHRVRGSHGRPGPGREVAWASTLDMGAPENVIELAQTLATHLRE